MSSRCFIVPQTRTLAYLVFGDLQRTLRDRQSKTYLHGLYIQKVIHNVVKQKKCIHVYKSTLKQHTLLDVHNTYKHFITNDVVRHATKEKTQAI